MDLSDGKSNGYIITNILNVMAPPVNVDAASVYREGTVAKILCTLLNNSTTSLDINPLRSTTSGSFLTDLAGSTANALTNIAFTTATIPASSVSTTRIIKTFIITAGSWAHVSSPGDVVLPP
jgi:hypothetical protein